MAEENAQSTSPSTCPSPLRERLLKALGYGAVAGIAFSGPTDLDIPEGLYQIPLAVLSMVCLFGLPAGLILGFLDSRRSKAAGWLAIVKVPSIIVGGSLLLFGLLTLPFAINLLARSGSEWLTGGAGNTPLRLAIGTLAGIGSGLLLLAMLMVVEELNRWAYAKVPNKPVERAEQAAAVDRPRD